MSVLVRMSAQIPAGQPSRVRKQSVHAGLGLRRIEDELSSFRSSAARRSSDSPSPSRKRSGWSPPASERRHSPDHMPEPPRPATARMMATKIRRSRTLRFGADVGVTTPDYKPSTRVPTTLCRSTLTTRPSDRQTTAFAGNRFWRAPAAAGMPAIGRSGLIIALTLRPWP